MDRGKIADALERRANELDGYIGMLQEEYGDGDIVDGLCDIMEDLFILVDKVKAL